LACIGALCGAALASYAFNGRALASSPMYSMTGQSFFQLSIGTGYFVAGALMACLLGLAVGLVPALRAASAPVAMAIRKS
jgi:ABC-type lipoprotein release transport system permease subunit